MGEVSLARSVVGEAKKNTGNNYFRILAELDLYGGDYSSAVKNIEKAQQEESISHANYDIDALLTQAKIYKYAAKPVQAREYYSQAEQYYSDQIEFKPDDYHAYSQLGIAYAALGKDQLAVESGQKALELAEEEYSAVHYPDVLYSMAQIYALIGDDESAVLTLKELLTIKSTNTSAFIKLDPDMKNLLDDLGI